MLAPSSITLRRPSCEADLILARIERESTFYPGLTPSDSVQSAPLYDYWAPDRVRLAESVEAQPSETAGRSCMTRRRQDSLGSLSISPDSRGRYMRRWTPKNREDGVGVRYGDDEIGVVGFRRASVTLRRSIDSLLCTLATKKLTVDQQPRLSIEVIQESPLFRRRNRLKQRGKSLDKVQEDAATDAYVPSQNHLSLSLVLVSLKDGLLSAEIPIDEMRDLSSGHVTIRIRNFNLDVCLSNGERNQQKDVQAEPCYRGSVSLPIYVNPSTLQFRLDDSRNVVQLEGKIKGCCTRIGTSLSAVELNRSAMPATVVMGN